MTIKNIEIRILDIFRTFDKVNQDNVSGLQQEESREEEEEEGKGGDGGSR